MSDNKISELINELHHNSGVKEVQKINQNTIRFDIPDNNYGKLQIPKYNNWYVDSMHSYTDITRVTMTFVK